MRDRDPIRTARRTALREKQVAECPFCLFCGYACLEALTRVTRAWLEENGIDEDRLKRLLEAHHLLGAAHDPNTLVTLCLNCHREITEKLAREGVSMRPEKNLHKLVALVLRASAVLFECLANSYRNWANILE